MYTLKCDQITEVALVCCFILCGNAISPPPPPPQKKNGPCLNKSIDVIVKTSAYLFNISGKNWHSSRIL